VVRADQDGVMRHRLETADQTPDVQRGDRLREDILRPGVGSVIAIRKPPNELSFDGGLSGSGIAGRTYS
jgi:hypothetical protein